MSGRSVFASIINTLSQDLHISDEELQSGVWSQDSQPTPDIPASQQGEFKAEGLTLLSGCQGTVSYFWVDGESRYGVVMNFDNPFEGSNSYSETISPGYQIVRRGGGGDNASVTYTITKDTEQPAEGN